MTAGLLLVPAGAVERAPGICDPPSAAIYPGPCRGQRLQTPGQTRKLSLLVLVLLLLLLCALQELPTRRARLEHSRAGLAAAAEPHRR